MGLRAHLFLYVTAVTTNERRSWFNDLMDNRRLRIGVAALALVIGTGAHANEIYKWTDEDGSVHYGDRPTGKLTEEQLKVTYNRTNPEVLEERVQAQNDVEEERREARAAAAEEKRAAEEERLAADEQQVRCDQARAQQAKLLQARSVYREDEAGERVYLDDVQRAESLARAETAVKEACGT